MLLKNEFIYIFFVINFLLVHRSVYDKISDVHSFCVNLGTSRIHTGALTSSFLHLPCVCVLNNGVNGETLWWVIAAISMLGN